MFFKTIVTVLVAQLILSAIKVIKLSVVIPNEEPGLPT